MRSSLKHDIEKLINSAEIADVHFVVGSQKYLMYGHKTILSLNSKFFLEKFFPRRPLSRINGKFDRQLTNNYNQENDNVNTQQQNLNNSKTNLQLSVSENDTINEEGKENENEKVKEKGKRKGKEPIIYFSQYQRHFIFKIEEPEIDCKSFQKFLNFFYTKKIEITPSDSWSILYCAQKYQVPELVKITIDYILSMVSKDTVLRLLEKTLECEQWYLYLKILEYFKIFSNEIFLKTGCLNKLIDKMVPLLLQSITEIVPSSTIFQRLIERIKYKYKKLKIPINTDILSREIRPLQKYIKFETFSMKDLRSVMNSSIISDQNIFGILLTKFEQIEKVCLSYQPKVEILNTKIIQENGNGNGKGKNDLNNRNLIDLEKESITKSNNEKKKQYILDINPENNKRTANKDQNQNQNQNEINEKLKLIYHIDKELIEKNNNNIDQFISNLENDKEIKMEIDKEKNDNLRHHINLLNVIRVEHAKAKSIINGEYNNNNNNRNHDKENLENENTNEKENENGKEKEKENENEKKKKKENEKEKKKEKEKGMEIEIEKGKEKENENEMKMEIVIEKDLTKKEMEEKREFELERKRKEMITGTENESIDGTSEWITKVDRLSNNTQLFQESPTLSLNLGSPLKNIKLSFFSSRIALLANDPHPKWRHDVTRMMKKCNLPVSTFDLTKRIPKHSELKNFRVVFHYSANAYKNPKQVGNLLGRLVERGIPLIICSCFAFNYRKSCLEGKITQLQMLPNFEEAELSQTNSELGTAEDHEIMKDIQSFDGGVQSYRYKKLKNFGQIIAKWRDRSILVSLFEKSQQQLKSNMCNDSESENGDQQKNTNCNNKSSSNKNRTEKILQKMNSNTNNFTSRVLFLNFFPVSRRVWQGHQKPWFSQDNNEKFHVGGDKIIQNSILYLLKERIFDIIKQSFQSKNQLIEKKEIQKQKILKQKIRNEKKRNKLERKRKRKRKN
ncbi:btb (poz) domain-containing 2a-related [Anaeramoeba flamelloides]|uniref:Btb (Poz) domain-containing 2a-related n=1 Tax=Anaeramoeba flamelloides TaxID=1746091 RepID=A0AAV7ZAE8_9EUKA|nr:btb (poz) domain-containing 2a-related [Anaeramoeba flamelloides]